MWLFDGIIFVLASDALRILERESRLKSVSLTQVQRQTVQAYREAIAIQSSHPHDPHSEAELSKSLHGLGTLLDQKGRYPEADQTLRRALALQRALPNGSPGDVAQTLKDLALERKRQVADKLRADLKALEGKYGRFPDGAELVREARDGRG